VLQAHWAAWQRGDRALARRIWTHFLPLIVFEQQPGVAVRKEILRRRGLIEGATVRHPGAGLAPGVAEQLSEWIEATLPRVDITRPIDAAAIEATAAGSG
jgi:4-hydroxy-tetrahydrodipicolinate synthase